jgi:hypothetical protein
LQFKIKKVEEGRYRLVDVFEGLEESQTLKKVFGDDVQNILVSTSIEINNHPWIIWVNERGAISINVDYLNKIDLRTLYLDIVHELVHIKQFKEGKKLFDERFSYANSPTEIEAYKLTVEEAQNIGLSKNEIIDYLKVDWITDEEHQKLVEAVMP